MAGTFDSTFDSTFDIGGVTLTSITITPTNASVLPAGTLQLTATGNYSDSSHADLTSSVTWFGLDDTIAKISSTGLVTGVYKGTVGIGALSGIIAGALILTVAEVPSPYGSITRIDHVATAISQLCQQFKDKPNIVALLTVFASRYNDLEAVFWAMLTLRNIAYAVGDQLDIIGKVVGLQRNGLDDTTYRTYLYAAIAKNRSAGTVEDLIRVAVLMLTGTGATVKVTNEGTATVRVLIKSVALTDAVGSVLADFEQAAALSGVRVITEWSNNLAAATFTFDAGPGFNVGHFASAKG